jgi:hypothetical protein
MDVQADEAGVRPDPPSDPHATAVFQRPPAGVPQPPARGARRDSQGQLFADPYPTYADTDKIPAVTSASSGRYVGPSRWLRVTVAAVAVVVLAAGVALGLVQAGVIGNGTPSHARTQTTSSTPSTTVSKAPLVSQVSTGSGSATYKVAIAAYLVTVHTSTGRSWVSIGLSGQTPVYQGILPPASSQKQILIGPSQVSVGAGGTTVVVSSGHRSVTLTPPSAPFSYSFVTKG